ncbi:FAD:protein FMN transferase [Engelhardtia mirabilis]|uniref:FAD:protein FMN transferase n=1 Tax=Engelhardtia mirabilis TaxID=2528011 RepID=A0A518BHK5_9BACT|nr:Thiamine biosynthesis lipoprotein ApbE precursor [Planctomycetes bacterium Pla133]QDV00772.1 Thiamine biosynthesis lipoprotein ApbE precursor [Planctomycetes bacterium Pla86]
MLTPLLITALMAQTTPQPAESGDAVRVERHLAVMGTDLTIEVDGTDRPGALGASEAALRAIEAAEARLSTWTPNSELSRLNRAPVGQAFELSPALAGELEAARRWSEACAGAFEPVCASLVRAWDLRGVGRVPTAAELAAARDAVGPEAIAVAGADRSATRLHAEAGFEEGGFGKGAGLDAALAALAESGAHGARLDLGGQMAWFGAAERRLLVADPDQRARPVVALALPADTVSAATSGNSERPRDAAGIVRGHLLDPRSGRPARDFGSITVVTSSGIGALAADVLSTGFFVLGPDAALAAAERLDGVDVLVLERARTGADLQLRCSSGLVGRFERIDSPPESSTTAPVIDPQRGDPPSSDPPRSDPPRSDPPRSDPPSSGSPP